MATATKFEIVPPVKPVTAYTLTLDEEEAQVLVDLSLYVGGFSHSSRRRLIDQIRTALEDVGVARKVTLDIPDIRGTIVFLNVEEIR